MRRYSRKNGRRLLGWRRERPRTVCSAPHGVSERPRKTGSRQRTSILACWLIAIAGNLVEADPAPLRLLRVTPDGSDVPPGQEIVLQFDRPVVPLGRMQRENSEVPVTVEPDPGCRWRWIDRTALACRLEADRPLLHATWYALTVHAEPLATDGSRLDRARHHRFLTRRPTVTHHRFKTWHAPGDPELMLVFDQAVRRASAERAFGFEMPDGTVYPVRLRQVEDDPHRFWLRPLGQLPLDTRVELKVVPGIRPVEGEERGAEDRVVVAFRTFPEFRFLGISCFDQDGGRLRVDEGVTYASPRRCDPLAGTWLRFSSPVIKEVLRDRLTILPNLAGDRTDYDPWERVHSYSRLNWADSNHEYTHRLPEALLAARTYRLRAEAELLQDEFGRSLIVPIDFRFVTDHRRPRLVQTHPVAVLESGVASQVPVTVTNLDALDVRLCRYVDDEIVTSRERLLLPQVSDLAFAHPLPIRDWLGSPSGAITGEISSLPPTRDSEWFFAQVTPFQVHAKIGYHNSLVFVTDLSSGKPVRNATVRIRERDPRTLASRGAPLGVERTDADGLARLAGTAVIDPDRVRVVRWQHRNTPKLFVEVVRGDDVALLPLGDDFRVQERTASGRWMYAQPGALNANLRSWGTTAQGIYRTGDTIRYKIWVRSEENRALAAAPPGSYTLQVTDPLGRAVHSLEAVELNRFGAFDGTFTVAEQAAVGWYRFELRADFAENWVGAPLELLITDFTPAPFRVELDLNGESFAAGDRLEFAAKATLHSGGPYVDAQTRITATLRSRPFTPDDPRLAGYVFPGERTPDRVVHGSDGTLDDRGEWVDGFAVPPGEVLFGRMTVEAAVRDDRGQRVATRSNARYLGRDRFLGIRQSDWVLGAGRPATVHALIVDPAGNPLPDLPVGFRIERRVTHASRVRGAGNAFLTHYTHSWEEVARCEATTGDADATCTFVPDGPGSYRLTALAQDAAGRPLRAEQQRWCVGPGTVLFEQSPDHQLRIEPEKTEHAVGERARFLVHNPYPGARALITVERLGVLESEVRTLNDSTAVIEVPIEADHVPGFYLSVLIVSPRVDAPPKNGVDLGKPGFRQGYVRVQVDAPYKRLEVDVSLAETELRPGARATIEIQARTHQGRPADAELAVVVLDESVVDLLPNGTDGYDPYAGFYRLGSLELVNFNLLTSLVGMRRIESKGANPGGGGSPDAGLRTHFDFVGYWNPSVVPDRRGRATLSFDVPDNLTGWRVLVLALGPDERMGLGQASFRVNRPTEIRPVLPNQVLTGDRFQAGFTVMNRTDQTRTIDVSILAEGPVDPTVIEQTVQAEPFRRTTVGLPLRATGPGTIRFDVRAGDATDRDRLQASLTVRRRKALETVAHHGSTAGPSVEESIHFPTEMRVDVGALSVSLSPSLIGGLEGAFVAMRDYPYGCWEQRLSKGVMASHYLALKEYLGDEAAWPEARSWVEQTLADATEFQAPGGGMAYFGATDERVSPYLSAYTALGFGWLRDAGHTVPAGVETRLHDYLRRLLRREVFPDFYSRGMRGSVRAVALAALARAGALDRSELERYRSHVPGMDLFGRAHVLSAAASLESSLARETLNSILAHADESAGKFSLVERLDDGFARIHGSETRTACAVLGALARFDTSVLRGAGADRVPFKLVRTIVASRQRRDRWENTQENIFCAGALIDYARAYEGEPPRMQVRVRLDDERLGDVEIDDRRQRPQPIVRPIAEPDRGREARLSIQRTGTGRLYYAARLSYSPDPIDPRRIDAGMELRREYSVERDGAWLLLGSPVEIELGELVRVDLYVDLPTARHFVVVEDPVPGGLEPLNADLATASTVDLGKARVIYPPDAYFHRYDDWSYFSTTYYGFYHREPRHHAYRFYADYLPAGRYQLSYVARATVPGTYEALPARAEEMYDPDVFGRGAPATIEVGAGS